jgi:hypothetical protein
MFVFVSNFLQSIFTKKVLLLRHRLITDTIICGPIWSDQDPDPGLNKLKFVEESLVQVELCNGRDILTKKVFEIIL